ncbi:MAG: hypothetical protein ABI923_09585 [bacterium]
MKILFGLTVLVCAAVAASAQQPTPSPVQPTPQRSCCAHRPLRRIASPVPPRAPRPATDPTTDFFVGEAKVDVTKDETVVRLAMALHGSVLIELPANDGPRYIIPGDPEMATVDEKALERNKRAIVVRPGSLFVPSLANRRVRTPAATVTAQMRSGLVVTFLFYPVEDLAQNVHRCVLSYNRDEVVARRRAAGLPVNLDTNNTNNERRNETGQSTALTSISVEENDDSKLLDKPSESKTAITETRPKEKAEVNASTPTASLPTGATRPKAEPKAGEIDERVQATARDALARAIKKPKQFKNWTKPAHGLALSILPPADAKGEFQVLTLAVRNTSKETLKIVSGSPDLFVELRDEEGKPINLESVKKLHVELSETTAELQPGKTVYYVIAYASPILGSHQQLKVVVGQTNAADEPASIALVNSDR